MQKDPRKVTRLYALILLVTVGCGSQVERSQQIGPPSQGRSQPSSSSANEINQALSLTAAQSATSTADYRIGPDDLLQITVYSIPEQDARATPRMVILRV